MKITAIYDNGGRSLDRYTVLTDNPYIDAKNRFTECLSLSEHPGDIIGGMSQWGGCIPGYHLGKRISFERLSEELQNHIAHRVFEVDVQTAEPQEGEFDYV